ncbi:DUF4173 domain-containing protein [bacterium]|nr:DUF4173 domain-containing protein [bacterium]
MKTDGLWIAAFFLGFLFSFGVLNTTPGLGLFLGVNALVIALWYFGQRNKESREITETKESKILLTTLTVVYVLLTFPYLYRLDYSIIGTLVAVHAIFLAVGALYFALPGMLHIVDILSLIISPIAFAVMWLVETVKSVFELFKENANVVKLLLKVILYSAASLLVFILFANLLSAADSAFKLKIDHILESLDLIVITQRTVIAVVMSFVSAGLLSIVGTGKILPLFGVSGSRAKELWDKAFSVVLSKRSDAILPIIITTPLFFLFALYVWLQFPYFTGSNLESILERFTYSDYARRGFAELLVVGVLTYPILAWSMTQSRSTWKLPKILTFAINTGVVSLLTLMLYSLSIRMNLYMQSYGASVLRYYVILGAVFVGIGLLAYEALAIVKTFKTEFALFRGRLMSDYIIVALFTGLGLLGAVSLYPWNNLVVNRLSQKYFTSGTIDISQMQRLPLESESLVYNIGKTLEADGQKESGLLLQAHALQEVSSYKSEREDTIFSRIFGFNFAGASLLTELPTGQLADINKRFITTMTEKVTAIDATFTQALETNNFALARSLYDPKMRPNDITGFASGVSVVKKITPSTGKDLGYYEPFLAGSNTAYINSSFEIIREGKKVEETSLSTTIGFRDGKIVVLDNTLILAFLPDAVSEKNDLYQVSNYGYRTFCKIPTLEVIYSASMGCTYGDGEYREFESKPMPVTEIGYLPMSSFLKSDFVAEAQ